MGPLPSFCFSGFLPTEGVNGWRASGFKPPTSITLHGKKSAVHDGSATSSGVYPRGCVIPRLHRPDTRPLRLTRMGTRTWGAPAGVPRPAPRTGGKGI